MIADKNMFIRLITHPVAQGTVIALAVSLLGTLLLSLICYVTPLSETYLQLAGNVLYLAGAFFGGFVGANKAGRKGMQFGAGTGLCYFVVFTIIVMVLAPETFTGLAFGLKGLYALIVAAVGGVFGIAFAE
ncbi:MAG: TIGR04086 family membrane protein [Thermacetogeniaceae bacterium]